MLAAALLPGTATAAPPARSTASTFDLSKYAPVNADNYRSLQFVDGGAYFFRAGRWLCQIGPSNPNQVACKGKPASAPPGTLGIAIPGEGQGPYWARPGTTFRVGPEGSFRPPVLAVGQRLTVISVSCAVPRAGVVVCRNWNRGFMLSRYSHKFLYPKGDTAHSRR